MKVIDQNIVIRLFYLFFVLALFEVNNISGNNSSLLINGMLNNSGEQEKTELYKKGIEFLKSNDTLKAESFFKESIRKFGDAASHFELARIYLHRNTFNSRNLAYENLRQAVWKDADNLEYRYAYASLMKDFARINSFDEYKKIISKDSTQVEAWLNLGSLKDEDYSEYTNSVRKMSDEFYGSLQEYADDDFREAEFFYSNALKHDSLNYNALLKLSLLYEKAGQPEKGIPLLMRLIDAKKDSMTVHLCLGLLYYKTSKLKECYNEYQKALSLMSKKEQLDFTYNSVKFLIEPVFEEVVDQLSDFELEQFIEVYWKVFDPLYMTDYNERLLEHYSRVAYANLHFSVPSMGIVGWKSNRGEVVLRYGEPLGWVRIRPSMGGGGVDMKTEVWNYKDMTFGFTDMALSGNYLFSLPAYEKDKVRTQFAGDTQFYIENLRRIRYTNYDPKFEGPRIDIPYSIVQFKSDEKRNHTDLYLSYLLEKQDSLFEKGKNSLVYNAGLYFFDKNYQEQFRELKKVEIEKSDYTPIVKSLEVTARSDSGYASFEVIRDIDKGTSANRTGLKIRKFSNNRLDLSDILLASNVSTEKNKEDLITRKKLFILPNPINEFSKEQPFYLYYEVYNLTKDSLGLTNFDQLITIKEYKDTLKSGFEKTVTYILNFLGIGGEEKITLTSNYRTLESDPQIYLQLDLGKYPSGKYQITVTIKDNLEKKEVSSSSILSWKN